jgi:hypothetical protein
LDAATHAASTALRSQRVGAVVCIAALGVLAANAARYHPFLSDDALISLRYARRLLDGHGLTFTEGRPVEGYSNLLWILLVAALGRLGVDLIDAARLLGLLGGALAVSALVFAWPARTPRQALPAAGGGLTIALAAPIGAWTVGGLEQPLVAACLAWATALCFPVLAGDGSRRAPIGASLCLGLLCLTRPDGPLFAVGALVACLLGKGPAPGRLRTALPLAAFPALCVVGQQVFRLATYGEWLPNPALVKLAPSGRHLIDGLHYVGAGLLSLSPLSELGLGVAVAGAFGFGAPDPARRARMRLVLIQAMLWTAYVAAIGGDIFPAYRQLVPLVVLLAFAVAEGLAWLAERRRAPRAALATAGALALALAAFAVLQVRSHASQRAIAERFEWRGQVVGLALARAFGDVRPLVAVTAAGCIPYWSGLPALDMLGLNDHHIARHRPPDFGEGRLAHELGDGAYVLARRPDLILYHVGSLGSDLRAGRELDAMPEYHEAYAPVTLVGSEPFEHRFVVWVRRDSEKVGIRSSGERVEIPGHLLAARGVGVARLDASPRFEAMVDRGNRGRVERIGIGPGAWRLEVDATAPVLARLATSRSGSPIAEGPVPLEFSVRDPEGLRLDVVLSAPPMTQARVGEARLVRVRPRDGDPGARVRPPSGARARLR